MANKRIIELTDEESFFEVETGDYFVTDNETNGTRKLDAKMFMANAGLCFPTNFDGICLLYAGEMMQNVVFCPYTQYSTPIACVEGEELTVTLNIPYSSDMPSYDEVVFIIFIGNCFVEGTDSTNGNADIEIDADIVSHALESVDTDHVTAVIRPHHTGTISKIQFNCIATMSARNI